MPTPSEEKEVIAVTSPRGQPVSADELTEAAKSIDVDTTENNSGQPKETAANST